MNIPSRLDALETKHQPAIEQHAAALADILARVDALFWPARIVGGKTGRLAALEAERSAYHSTGIHWAGLAEGNSRAWKQNERQRAALETAGLVRISRAESTPRLRLTKEAEHSTRRALGLATLYDAIPRELFRVITEAPADSPLTRAGGWVAEGYLAGWDYTERPKPSDWDALTELMLPMLTAGIVESRTSTTAQIYYRAARPLPALEDEPQIEITSAPDSILEVYSRAFGEGSEARERLENQGAEIYIPLSATR
jgi:hypothetical protein